MPKELSVTTFTQVDSQTCASTPFESITIGLSDTITGPIISVKLQKGEEEAESYPCSITEEVSSFSCSVTGITEGAYKIVSIEGDDNFSLGSDLVISYETDPLEGVTQDTPQIVKSKTPKFIIKLKSEDTTNPPIRIGPNGTPLTNCNKLTEDGKKNIV